MRSSYSGKYSKGRNKNTRSQSNRSNNRNYDSNGPEGKLRGTPQVLVEKYLACAKEASAAGNNIMAESYNQYAEHYARIIAELEDSEQPAQSAGARGRGQKQNISHDKESSGRRKVDPVNATNSAKENAPTKARTKDAGPQGAPKQRRRIYRRKNHLSAETEASEQTTDSASVQ